MKETWGHAAIGLGCQTKADHGDNDPSLQGALGDVTETLVLLSLGPPQGLGWNID